MYFRFRNPINYEPKDSRIEWEKLDSDTTRRLLAAIRKDNALGTPIGRIIVTAIFFFPISMLVFLIREFSSTNTPFLLTIPFLAPLIIIITIFIIGYLQQIPWIHEKIHPNIWVFHSKCNTIRNYNPSHHNNCIAEFHKRGKKIYLHLLGDEYKSDPVGKDYIFYKFNNRTGNYWKAIQARKLDDIKI